MINIGKSLFTESNKFQIDLEYLDKLTMNDKKIPNSQFLKEDFRNAFEPVFRFTPVKVFQNGKLIFQQKNSYKEIIDPEYKKIILDDLEIYFGIYGPPPWFLDEKGILGIGRNANFWRWLGSPEIGYQ